MFNHINFSLIKISFSNVDISNPFLVNYRDLKLNLLHKYNVCNKKYTNFLQHIFLNYRCWFSISVNQYLVCNLIILFSISKIKNIVNKIITCTQQISSIQMSLYFITDSIFIMTIVLHIKEQYLYYYSSRYCPITHKFNGIG
jgi:hypothetical protein